MRDLIEAILSQPTAPFRESWVKRALFSTLADLRLPVFEDAMGNLWAGARSRRDVAAASLVLVAHMDHPGIVIQKFRRTGRRILADGIWLGGGPMDIRNHEVQLFSDVNALVVLDGVVKRHTTGSRGPERVTIEVTGRRVGSPELAQAACTPQGLKALGPWGACLWYRKDAPTGVTRRAVSSRTGVAGPLRGTSPTWVTKAADDLIGVCAILHAMKSARKKGIVALLSRAEESGFHGTLHAIQKRMLDPRKALIISVETSSQLPGATLGNGPVVRLGDRLTVFDPALVHWVQNRAEELARRDRGFKFQRRVMDGGACEATAFNCFGFRVAGLSTPLENYHNQDLIRGTRRPRPEAVATQDVDRLAKLLTHIIRSHRPVNARAMTRASFSALSTRLLRNFHNQVRQFDNRSPGLR